MDFEKLGVFYLGRAYDLEQRQGLDRLLLYDSKDLVTHAVCVGMTGSGKTGLCVGLLEEAAIDNIPALVIDPKGDLANLLLTFPNLSPEEFGPWVTLDDAARQGVPPEQYPAHQAQLWREGLARWGQDASRIRRLRDAAELVIYTPGSNAGLPVSVLKSFGAPADAILDDRELLRERINATVTALLALIGIDADPIQSREYILLATLLDTAWREGRDLDLAAVIQQIQEPPMARIGVLDLDSFYPAKDRFKLAMALNSLLASPGFEAWLEGDPLDVGSLLYTRTGKPRIAIFSIAHLNDAERMFFVSLLLNQALSWMRAQPGTSSLRAIVYMDEIFGYFPPVANPPSKTPLLTLLKQARAFGLGVVLATQNPVDLDYKGLSNAGTWFIGRLQTERDKERVLDGLEGAATNAGGRLDRQRMAQTLAALGSRVFLMNNVHGDAPEIFETRWCLSYLRGPMTRAQIKSLMDPHKAAAARIPAAQVAAPASSEPGPRGQTLEALVQVRFTDARRRIDVTRDVLVRAPVVNGVVRWQDAEQEDGAGSAIATGGAFPRNAERDLVSWLYSNAQLELLRSAVLGEISSPGEDERDFRLRLLQIARERRDVAKAKVRAKYGSKRAVLEDRLFRAEQAVEREKAQRQAQSISSAISVGSTLLGALLGRGVMRSAASSARSMARSRKEALDVQTAEERSQRAREQLSTLDREIESELEAAASSGDPMAEPLETVTIRPKKADIVVRAVSVAAAGGWVVGEKGR